MWTSFMDMHSGGRTKHGAEYIYIEAPEEEARVIFYNRFGTSPDRVTCTCCGSDYSVDEGETLEEVTGYNRGCDYNRETQKYEEKPSTGRWASKYIPLDEYIAQEHVLVIRAGDIKEDERQGDVPVQGYVWQ